MLRVHRRGALALSRCCLDTSACSHFRRGEPEVVDLLSTARWIGVPVIVLGELRAGFRQGSKATENEQALGQFMINPVVVTLMVDDEASHRYADLVVGLRRRGTPVPTNDVWVGALALREGATVLTFDEHFDRMVEVSSRILQLPKEPQGDSA